MMTRFTGPHVSRADCVVATSTEDHGKQYPQATHEAIAWAIGFVDGRKKAPTDRRRRRSAKQRY
jgi:hypothetical protein